MAKNVISDIVTNKSPKPGSLRPKAPAPSALSNTPAQKKETEAKVSQKVSNIFNKPTNYPAFRTSANQNGPRVALWALAAVCVIFLVFAISALFGGATVTLTPKSQAFTLESASFSAEKDDPESDLPFQIMTLTDSAAKTVVSSKTETVDKKASGRVVIYNSFGKEAQKLVVNTRLETADGKIYRIDSAVTVPGMTGSTPGSVEVGAHADKAGAEYNIGLTDFTIPGFKGSSKYEKFYARSKTEMAGAISGQVYVLDPKDVESIKAEFLSSLKDKLMKKAEGELPKEYVLFKDSANFELTNPDATFESKDSSVPVTFEGKLTAVIFDETKMTSKIALSANKDWDSKTEVYIPDLNKLNFLFKNDPATVADSKEINFSLSGSGKIIWKFDEEKFKSDLLGKKKSALKDVLAMYPSIARAEAKLTPPFRSTFPKNAKDIKVINTEAQK